MRSKLAVRRSRERGAAAAADDEGVALRRRSGNRANCGVFVRSHTLAVARALCRVASSMFSRALSKHSDESLFLKTVARTLEKKGVVKERRTRPPGRYSLNTRSSPRRVAKSKMADSRVVTTTTHSFHPKALSFFSLSLSLSSRQVLVPSPPLSRVYSFEREDPPLISSIHFLFVFFNTFFVSTSRVSSSFLHSRETSNHHLLLRARSITF